MQKHGLLSEFDCSSQHRPALLMPLRGMFAVPTERVRAIPRATWEALHAIAKRVGLAAHLANASRTQETFKVHCPFEISWAAIFSCFYAGHHAYSHAYGSHDKTDPSLACPSLHHHELGSRPEDAWRLNRSWSTFTRASGHHAIPRAFWCTNEPQSSETYCQTHACHWGATTVKWPKRHLPA